MTAVWNFIKREKVLVIAFIAAVISCFFVKPSKEYLDYIDLRTLVLLFCLMVVSAGLEDAGFISKMAQVLMHRCKTSLSLNLVLILLPLFVAMLVTNDVALITFVPFAIVVLTKVNRKSDIIPVVVLQTIAANMGGMATPVGNPQNLYIYNKYEMSSGDFFGTVLPIAGISLVLLVIVAFVLGRKAITVPSENAKKVDLKVAIACAVLFVVCLLAVFRVLKNIWILLAIVVVVMLVIKPKLLLKADFFLLLTFVCFFVFAGNFGRIETVKEFVSSLMDKEPFWCAAGLSQIISNVPAAVLLSNFTNDSKMLLLGVDIGGLGTPIASLASLISMKIYGKSEGADTNKFLVWFLAANVVGLVLLAIAKYLIY